jgi:hypothetical protein
MPIENGWELLRISENIRKYLVEFGILIDLRMGDFRKNDSLTKKRSYDIMKGSAIIVREVDHQYFTATNFPCSK